MDEYVLSEDEVRAAWVDREYEFGDTTDRARADFDRFLARVRRDAAREALDGLAEDVRAEWDREHRWVASAVGAFRDNHHAEETP